MGHSHEVPRHDAANWSPFAAIIDAVPSTHELPRLLQIEVPTRSVPVDAAISSDHPLQHHRGTQGAPVLDLQDAWQLQRVHRRRARPRL